MLKNIAATFRAAIIRSNTKPEFPLGCCKVVSAMLAKHLVEEYSVNPNEITYVQAIGEGNYENSNIPDGHFWLDINGVSVDIMASQFAEISETVVVTTDWIWGNRFQEKRVSRFTYYDLSLSGFHLNTYVEIMATLPSIK